jgi:hypothetical protein
MRGVVRLMNPVIDVGRGFKVFHQGMITSRVTHYTAPILYIYFEV